LVAVLSSIRVWKKWIISILSLALIFFIFSTRIYLGVHFPTDIIGSFFFGMASLWISVGVYILVREPLRALLEKMNLHDRSTMFVRQRSR
ncbi:MAG TPA: phosphatase PAP2 family protein, partial [Bacillota bacterium]|nr:phosphatase PAP2 family protein [Bacillota bacterium]